MSSQQLRRKQALFDAVEAPASLHATSGTSLKACLLCGGRAARRLYMQAHFPVVTCSACGLVYADEHFRAEELQAFYRGDYYQRAYVCHPREIDRKIAGDYARCFAEVDRTLGGGRLLDFGSARGTFLAELTRRGLGDRWRLEGIDINPDEVRMGQEAGLAVRCASLPEAGYPDGAFDAVSAFSVLEHLQDPVAVLRELARITRPGGRLLLIVPSGECLIIQIAVAAARMLGRRVRRFTDNVFHEEHLYYFGRETITRALLMAGFTVRKLFHLPSYLETHPPGAAVAAGAWSLRLLSWMLRRQTMLVAVAERLPDHGGAVPEARKQDGG